MPCFTQALTRQFEGEPASGEAARTVPLSKADLRASKRRQGGVVPDDARTGGEAALNCLLQFGDRHSVPSVSRDRE